MNRIISLIGMMTVMTVFSYAHVNQARRQQQQQQPSAVASYKTENNDCRVPVAMDVMEINNVRTTLLTAGDLWWNLTTAKYEIPKGDGNPGIHSIFEGAIWISGRDNTNNLKLAALTYRSGNSDFFAGPLDNTGNTSATICNMWDKHFSVFATEIIAAQSEFASQHIVAANMTDNLKNWPGKGNPNMIASGYDMSSNLAPFHDGDGDGIYDPSKGDYPTIKDSVEAYADQMMFWVFNDRGNIHTQSNGTPIGVQLNAIAFAFQTSDEVNNMTFYTYNIINKSGLSLYQTYMSQYADPDLGCYNDDYVGCDTSRSMAFVYNSIAPDPNGCNPGMLGYGQELPMLGMDFFEGPVDTNGVQKGLSSFAYYTNAGALAQSDPSGAAQFRNYQEGKWADGSPLTYGGLGYGGSVTTSYCFSGNPGNPTAWSECHLTPNGTGNQAGDRRFVMTSGPFTFLPNATQHITIGVIWVRPQGGVGLCPDVNIMLGAADDKAQSLFNSGFRVIKGPDAPTVDIRELDKQLILSWTNLYPSNNVGENYKQDDAAIYTATGFHADMDSFYHFQGYAVYQLASDAVNLTIDELSDKTKAILIAQYDVRDSLVSLINYTKDVLTGQFIIPNNYPPQVGNGGQSNSGVQHSLAVTSDAFSNTALINHKPYYFGVIAYAANRFKPYNATNPSEGGQTTPYLQGGGTRFAGIPHSIDSRNGGTVLESAYGEGVEVKRIAGQANAGAAISLTDETLNKIVSSSDGFVDTLVYEKGFSPIGFKVVDPVTLVAADFELLLKDSTLTASQTQLSPDAWWTLRVLDDNGSVIDSVNSEASLGRPYEQMITTTRGNITTDYGFSLSLGIPASVDSNQSNQRLIYNAIGGSITYADSVHKWLSFVADSGVNSVTNWIRSGTLRVTPVGTNPNANAGVYDALYYQVGNSYPFIDDSSYFDKIAGGTWAPYCLAANYYMAKPSICSARPQTPPTVHGPGFRYGKWQSCPFNISTTGVATPLMPSRSTLDRLQSVQIVITPDKSKWSQCVVFETGEDMTTVQGGARKGLYRKAASLDIDGNVTTDGDSGRSWFPGYAVNMETGQRLNIAFGESSELPDQNGADMLWNPTSKEFGDIPNYNYGDDIYTPFFGGKHFIYVMETPYDKGIAMRDTMSYLYAHLSSLLTGSAIYSTSLDTLYKHIMYTSMPYLTKGFTLKSVADGIVPSEVRVKIQVERPLQTMLTNEQFGSVDSLPHYWFSTKGMQARTNVDSLAKSALDAIRIVPNPYLAYSAYEQTAADTRVKITNLPNNCTIQIYALDGTIVRTLRRAINTTVPDPATGVPTDISDGVNYDKTLVSLHENTVDTYWDLKNEANVPVASGIYLFDITAPGIGHKVLKWFGAMRPADVSNF